MKRYLVQHMKDGRWEDAYESPPMGTTDTWSNALNIYHALVSDKPTRIMQICPWRVKLIGAPSGGDVSRLELEALETQWTTPTNQP